ncbi:hypothetical protein PRBRB14_13860 [Hallella multisaccharivorax DSM 17128]|nr:hypothetical protein PRBRB14_13860 [Hallella multisaccharivorax DSM 17128]
MAIQALFEFIKNAFIAWNNNLPFLKGISKNEQAFVINPDYFCCQLEI